MWTFLALAYAIGGLVSCRLGPAAEAIPLPKHFSGKALQRGAYYLVMYTVLFAFWPLALAAAKQPKSNVSNPAELQNLFAFMEALNTAEGEVEGDEFPDATGEFGYTAESPIPCRSIPAAYDYLQRISTASGRAVTAERIGSTLSSVSSKPIDMFKLQVPGGIDAILFISPYQKRTSNRPPKGFHLSSGKLRSC